MTHSRTYAVGDVHGCYDRLERLLARCFADGEAATMHLVFVGDYIDRGPDSRAVVQRLIDLQRAMPGRVVCLRGNHEVLMLDALATGHVALWQFTNGGAATLASYGVERLSDLPAEHLGWFNGLPVWFDDGLRFYVHAGVDPNRPLDAQREHDLVWIREPFLSTERDFGRLIVHGHTPQRNGQPDMRRWRLNLDTAAVYGGRLTAAVFTGEQRDPIAFLTD